MITITNYHSGELLFEENGHSQRLTWEESNRLILFARMHSVPEFIENLPRLIPDAHLHRSLLSHYESISGKSDRWNFKEKFARLHTVAKGHQPADPQQAIECVTLG